MLRELSIRDFAIIDDLTIPFSGGLTILSGETGAGKSIIVNAVNLLLGSRASSQLIRTGAESAQLEAMFDIIPESHVAKAMVDQGLDPEEGLIIRRVIARNDRHRVYVNGQLSTMTALNRLTGPLASISGQHAHQGLLKEENHLEILDACARLSVDRETAHGLYQKIRPLITALEAHLAAEQQQAQQSQLLAFQEKEIADAGVTPGEDEQLEHEQRLLKNAEALYQSVHNAISLLYSAQGSVVERLGAVQKDLEQAKRIDPALDAPVQQLSGAAYQIEDIAQELRNYLSNIQIDNSRLEAVEARLDTLFRLKRKYGGRLEAVLAHQQAARTQLAALEDLSETIAQTQQQIQTLHATLVEKAKSLSVARRQAAEDLSSRIEAELASLSMAHAQFRIALNSTPADPPCSPWLTTESRQIGPYGIDQAVFLMAPNPGEAIKPLAAIASGGELSRVVLALKAILAQNESVQTIVFDEVDAGIGGSVAEVVGEKLAALAGRHQVICITHLPQIAAFAHHHLRIAKQVTGGRTQTTIEPVDDDRRVAEIARMLGGVTITQATLDHAREMIKSR